jgi:CheY-like chemotaxis protein
MLQRVFDGFVQQPHTAALAQGGLGLGLTIVRSFVEQHGGSVSAYSEGRGHGAEFVVKLPALRGAPCQASPARPAQFTRAGSAPGVRVLIVDDNVDVVAVFRHRLEELGYEVAVAYDGPTALRVAAEFDPKIALVDIGLPGLSGHEVARQLRAQAPSPGLHLVAVTGFGHDIDRERSVAAGFERYLIKPIDLSQLEQVVGELSACER